MLYIESPSEVAINTGEKSLFLAGGITGCPDWQQEMVRLLGGTDLVLINPRRKDFPIGNPNAAVEQIAWEHHALRTASSILFWFPCETVCPIVLYELGAWSMTDKPIYVGVHPNYSRRQDVEIQTKLARPDVTITYSLSDLADCIIHAKANRDSKIEEMVRVLNSYEFHHTRTNEGRDALSLTDLLKIHVTSVNAHRDLRQLAEHIVKRGQQ